MPVDENDKSNAKGGTKSNDDRTSAESVGPSMTMALFFYWILPVLLFSTFGRHFVDTSIPTVDVKPLGPPPINQKKKSKQNFQASSPSTVSGQKPSSAPTGMPSASSRWPTSYKKTVQKIQKNRLLWVNKPMATRSSTKAASPSETPSRTKRSSNPQRNAAVDRIDRQREQVKANPSDIMAAIDFADMLRGFDLTFREGGTFEAEAIETYQRIITIAEAAREESLRKGERTDQAKVELSSVSDEAGLEYESKSPDGLLCALRCALGKVYYMANMFERAEEQYSKCLGISPFYLDALNSRGSALIILGKLELAANDFLEVIIRDGQRMFNDAFSGIARVLEAKESSVEGGWEPVVDTLDRLIPLFEDKLKNSDNDAKHYGAKSLNRFHHTLFSYHDRKTKDYAQAWHHLTKSYEYKMSVLPAWKQGSEKVKAKSTRQVFTPGFWSSQTGSSTRTPIFVIGFVRSGSTLLERVLDSHPLIVGTGENSVFNGRLDDIRNQLVQASQAGKEATVPALTKKLADEVVEGYRHRWEALESNNPSGGTKKEPKRFVDKMLTNYYNVGFIHLLYPRALILHVHRNPMDSVFSAYKHEFPGGTLDYTSDFDALTELYHSYRDMIEHWDDVLPGRVTHVCYEDMVQDMPDMARAIIDATGLPWDDGVLEFHKKKHAVNTLSTTQVRKGVYKDSLKSWVKYEAHLQPMVENLGDRLDFKNLKTLQPAADHEEL